MGLYSHLYLHIFWFLFCGYVRVTILCIVNKLICKAVTHIICSLDLLILYLLNHMCVYTFQMSKYTLFFRLTVLLIVLIYQNVIFLYSLFYFSIYISALCLFYFHLTVYKIIYIYICSCLSILRYTIYNHSYLVNV